MLRRTQIRRGLETSRRREVGKRNLPLREGRPPKQQ
jgi:hypothetical protein